VRYPHIAGEASADQAHSETEDSILAPPLGTESFHPKTDALAPNPINRSEHIAQHASNPGVFLIASIMPNQFSFILRGF
jgi:hypothetical protein